MAQPIKMKNEKLPDTQSQPTQRMVFITSAADLEGHKKILVDEHFIKSLNAHVYLRVPDAQDRGLFDSRLIMDRPKAISTIKMDLCQMSMCDANGKLIFPTLEAARKVLGELDHTIIEEISELVQQKMKITEVDIQAELKKS